MPATNGLIDQFTITKIKKYIHVQYNFGIAIKSQGGCLLVKPYVSGAGPHFMYAQIFCEHITNNREKYAMYYPSYYLNSIIKVWCSLIYIKVIWAQKYVCFRSHGPTKPSR